MSCTVFDLYYRFDCSSMDEDHLIETFYITRPHFQQSMPEEDQLPVGSLKNMAEEAGRTITVDSSGQNPPRSVSKNIPRDDYLEQSYRMISRQINCSAAVSVSRGSKGKSRGKKQPQKGSSQFMQQFDDFFRSFIPP